MLHHRPIAPSNASPRLPRKSERSIPHSLRIPEHLARIHHILDAQQLRVRRAIEVLRMRLRGRQAGIHIIRIPRKRRARLSARKAVLQPVDEVDAGRGERVWVVRSEAIVLNHPQRGAVRVCGG